MEETWGHFIDIDDSLYSHKKKNDDIHHSRPKKPLIQNTRAPDGCSSRYNNDTDDDYDNDNDDDNDNNDDNDDNDNDGDYYDDDNEKYYDNLYCWCGFCINIVVIVGVCWHLYEK